MHPYATKGKMRRKNFNLTSDLAVRAEAVAAILEIDFSQVLREALHQFVEKIEKEKMDGELGAACRNYREYNKQFSSDWSHFETKLK